MSFITVEHASVLKIFTELTQFVKNVLKEAIMILPLAIVNHYVAQIASIEEEDAIVMQAFTSLTIVVNNAPSALDTITKHNHV